MNQSENIHELATALSKAQGEMQAAIKDSVNPFFKSKYADLGSVWDAARPVLCKYGLCVIQATDVINDKIVMVTTLAHSSGQWIKSIVPLNPAKNDSQSLGTAMTYLRRYSLSAIVGVVCDDDDDGNKDAELHKQEKNKQAPKKPEMPPIDHFPEPPKNDPKISSEQVGIVLDLMKHADPECVTNMYKYLNKVGVHAEMDITQSMYGGIVSALERNIKAKENK